MFDERLRRAVVDGVKSRSTWLRGVVERREDKGAERCAAAREQEEGRLGPIQSAGDIPASRTTGGGYANG